MRDGWTLLDEVALAGVAVGLAGWFGALAGAQGLHGALAVVCVAFPTAAAQRHGVGVRGVAVERAAWQGHRVVAQILVGAAAL